MSKPRISVVMSVYKEPVEWLRQSIDSVLNQTFSDFEFIIICDNPAYGEGMATLKEYTAKDNRIKLIFNEENIGLTKSLNKGLAIAQGEYIARMDADDVSKDFRLKTQVQFMDAHMEIDVCGSNIKAFGECEKLIKYPETMSDMYLYLESPFAHPVVMIRRDSLKGLQYSESCRFCQDYDLWSRLYWKGAKFYNIQDVLLDYRYSTSQIMSTNNKNQLEISKSIRKLNLQKTLRLFDSNYELDKSISLGDLYNVPRIIKAPKPVIQKLRYFLYLSVPSSTLVTLLYLLRTGDICRLKMDDLLHVLYYKMRKINQAKF